MTAMKGFSMNKVLGTIKRKPTAGGGAEDSSADENGDSPQANAARYVRQFCESGGNQSGDEITFLPPIVEAAESSPAAAAECARLIRKFLHKDHWSKPSFQYNAIMLIRILADNPGPTFTRNMDKKFVDATKELLKSGRDPSVRQMLMETLDAFENTKGHDEGLGPLIEMWKKEKDKAYRAYGGRPAPGPRPLNAPPAFSPQATNYFSRTHSTSHRRLPDPVELANRLEEARTSAKLLEQVVACTPPSEVLSNELITEFADRCQSASRSIQGYMAADDPGPDNDTMESLLDTNEQLQQALNHHQRAVLGAKKQLGLGERSNSHSPAPTPPQVNQQSRPAGTWQASSSSSSSAAAAATTTTGVMAASSSAAPSLPNRRAAGADDGTSSSDAASNGKGKAAAVAWDPPTAGSSRPAHNEDDPFRDPDDVPRLAYEPFHPGFSSAPRSDYRTGDPVTPISDDDLYDNDPYSTTAKQADSSYRY